MVTTQSASKASKSSHASEQECPVCKGELARTEFQAATKELENLISEKHLEVSRKQKKEFDSILRELKVNQRRELQTLRKNLKNQQMSQSKRLAGQSKKEKQSFERQMREMKKNHKLALQDTREVYEKQNLMSQKEQEKAVNIQLKEIMQTYSGLASNYQKELEKVRKMQDVHETVVRRKESEVARLKIELAKSNNDIQIRRLVVQLGERNAAIEQLQGRIRELESIMMDSSYSPRGQTNNNNNVNNNLDSTFDERQQAARAAQSHQEEKETDDSGISQRQRDLRDEFMTAIKEITREHKRAHEDNININTNSKDQGTPAPSEAENSDSTSMEGKDLQSSKPSKMGKMRNWFF